MPTASVNPGRYPRLAHRRGLLHLAMRQRPDWMIADDPRFYRMLLGLRASPARAWRSSVIGTMRRRSSARASSSPGAPTASSSCRGSTARTIDARAWMWSAPAVLYNPIDTGRFRPSAAVRASTRGRLGFSDEDVVVGYIGRMTQVKGLFTLLESAERFLATEAALRTVVGRRWRRRARRCSRGSSARRDARRHRFLGWEANMAALYPALDILAVPSLYPEPFGRVSVEAQATEIPVVSSLDGWTAGDVRARRHGHWSRTRRRRGTRARDPRRSLAIRSGDDGWARPAANGPARDSRSSA